MKLMQREWFLLEISKYEIEACEMVTHGGQVAAREQMLNREL